MRTIALAGLVVFAVLFVIASGRVPALGSPGKQVQIGALELEAEWTGETLPVPLDHPMGIAVDAAGRVLVADGGNARLVVFDGEGDVLEVWPLPGNARPVAIAARPDGTVLVTDYTGDRVLVLGEHGEILDEWGTTGSGEGEFRAPSGIAVTPAGTVIVVEFMGQRVQELDTEGKFVRFVTGGDAGRRHAEGRPLIPGMEEMAGMEGMARMRAGNPHGLFLFPSAAAIGPDGTLYVSNTHAYEILVFDTDNELRDAWGTKGSDAGEWEVPVGMATDAAGTLYVADSANFRVQAMGRNGEPRLVSRADERWWVTTRRIYSPTDVAVGPDGKLYVADFAASRVQRFQVLLR